MKSVPEVYRFRGFYVPERMMKSIESYIEEGRPVGDFLTAIICNDLQGAVSRADDENIGNLPAYAAYFYNEAPSKCHGSKENMKDWMNNKREGIGHEG